MSKRALVGFALVTMIGCGPTIDVSSTRAAIIDGMPDAGDPQVVAIVRADAPSQVICSGTLISDRVVITAAHCGVTDNETSFSVLFGNDVGAGGAVVPILLARRHPDADATATHDLELLLLGGPAKAKPAQMATGAPEAMSSVRIVGFGTTEAMKDLWGKKGDGTSLVTDVAATSLTLKAGPSLPCSGDSGGAVFDGDALTAVISRGDAGCADYARATRIDAHLDSFIRPFVTSFAPKSAVMGATCLYDDQCTTGRCATAVDDPAIRYCGGACSDDGGCAPGMRCSGGQCVFPAPTPGATGSLCSRDTDCVRGQCLPEGVCTVRCSSNSECPTNYSCIHRGGIDFFCTKDPELEVKVNGGGCALRGGDGSWSTILIAAIAARRRRQATLSRRGPGRRAPSGGAPRRSDGCRPSAGASCRARRCT